ncbi:MAG: amino acid ABC transporter permease, partial [Eubacteriales bacterium]|nr:amino acid ABC transporter permease [Eubacteriales bacterium]
GLSIALIKVLEHNGKKLFFLTRFANLYLTVIRGTPVVVQLLIIYYVIFGSVNISKVLVASLAFGINSGAYVAEIIRAGILAVDRGQMEAGRSLGLTYSVAMRRIVLPQAIKNILPALFNELITLLKETAVAGYIAVADLTRSGDMIRSRTFDAFMPLLAVALIYLLIVMMLTRLMARVERRLRRSDHR